MNAPNQPPRIALIGCEESQRSIPQAACDLYTSSLFLAMRAWAESRADRWYVLSARHGLLHPTEVIDPYVQSLGRMRRADRACWAGAVDGLLARVLPRGAEVVILAGSCYGEHLAPPLRRRGHPVTMPLSGLSRGEQFRILARPDRQRIRPRLSSVTAAY